MSVIKKAVCLILAAALLSGCSTKAESKDNNGKLKIVTTVFPAYDFARQIGGDNAEVDMLLSPGSDSHSYEPSPQDMLDIGGCDIFIYIGGSDEYWAEKITQSLDGVLTVRLSDSAELLWDEDEEEHGHDHDHAAHEDLFDPHIWTSPSNALRMLDAIADAFCETDSDNAETYRQNSDAYAQQIQQLITDTEQAVNGAENGTLIFADKFAFRYFTHEFGLNYAAAFHSCDEHSEPGAKTVASLIDTVKEKQLPAVYYFEFNSDRTAKTIAEETGAQALMLYSCHTVSQAELDAGETYVSLMRKNLEQLKIGLGN
ncbi:MAG: zinc ABC transporter substrate-binding protein [Eubacterium sp.]|nr:zinc ABC transporter substrate-binding protein [Eubacterium sp.]